MSNAVPFFDTMNAAMTPISQMMDLHGRIALVTGAAGHIGRAIALTLAELGAELVLVDLPGPQLGAIVAEVATRGTAVDAISCDLERGSERERLVAAFRERHQVLDILVNNAAFVGTAGLEGWAKPFLEQSVDTWRRALEVNLTAPFDLCKSLTPELLRGRGASVINIGSIYGEFGPDWSLYEGTAMANPAAYAASKGGLLQLTRWLATTLGPSIRVNAISPGGVARNQPEVFVARYVARTPLGRMATEDDFRGTIAYLASDMSSYVTGQNLSVNGGWGVW